jgi:hypothetical protein
VRNLLCRLGFHRLDEVRILFDDFNPERDIVFTRCGHCGHEPAGR